MRWLRNSSPDLRATFLTLASKCLALYAISHEVKKAGVTYKTYLHTSKHTNYNVKGAIREIKTFFGSNLIQILIVRHIKLGWGRDCFYGQMGVKNLTNSLKL